MTETLIPPPSPAPAALQRNFWRSRAARFLILIFIVALLGLPLLMIGLINGERQSYQYRVADEIGGLWGQAQTLSGPALVVPFERRYEATDSNGKTTLTTTRAERAILPKSLDIAADTKTEIRRRGIYDVPVYTAETKLTGAFEPQGFAELFGANETPLWSESYVSFLVSDPRAFRENMTLDWGGKAIPLEPSARLGRESGVHARVGDPRQGTGAFSAALPFNGSRYLRVAPLGEGTTAAFKGDWPHPGFDGAFLPTTREITPTGFSAQWRVPYVARNFPQSFVEGEGENLARAAEMSAFGLSFAQPVNPYQKVERALKYGLLFVAMTLLSVFLIETQARRPVHAVQYLMMGLAQCVFFLLLLAFSEQIGFTPSYLLAAAACVLLVSGYAGAALKIGKAAWSVLGALTVIYSFLYLLLRSQDYALLIGSIASFAALAATMWLTRDVDWRDSAD